MTDWRAGAQALAKELTAAGAVRDPAWQQAFTATPRHQFVPRFYLLDGYNQPRTLLTRDDPAQHDDWLAAAYRNEALVTRYQVAGTMADGQEIRVAASSASSPRLVALMLDRLAVTDGHTVLEIGTGTGYNAALLAARLGDRRVTSIEIDSATAAEADHHLAAAGYRPHLVTGDGAAGYPTNAPYHRIIATCAVPRVPPAWIDQLAPDGLVVAPLTLAGGPLAVLRKTNPTTVTGRIDPQPAYFMPLHPSERADAPTVDIPADTGPGYRTTTAVDLDAWARPDFRLWLALHQPHLQVADTVDPRGTRTGVVVYTGAGRAAVDYQDGAPGAWPVAQDHTRLWDGVEVAWSTWQRYGQPTRARLGVTTHAGGDQYAWLDQPDGPVTWPLPR